MTHLAPDEFVDAADGVLSAARLQHVDACGLCRCELETVVDMLRAGAAGPVPEPSPLFWDHFSARVRKAIAAEPSRIAASIGGDKSKVHAMFYVSSNFGPKMFWTRQLF